MSWLGDRNSNTVVKEFKKNHPSFLLTVTEESHEEPAFQNFMQESMSQYWKRNDK